LEALGKSPRRTSSSPNRGGNATGLQDVDVNSATGSRYTIQAPQRFAEELAAHGRFDDLAKWVFPDVTLASRAYLVVFASGKNRTNAAAELHHEFSAWIARVNTSRWFARTDRRASV
jgi:hypothetical protein